MQTAYLFAKLGKHRYFTKIDLAKGYWQVPMSQDSKDKTAFVAPVGLFQFTVMPHGLVNAPETFCKMIRKLLYGMDNIPVESIVDDIDIHRDLG